MIATMTDPIEELRQRRVDRSGAYREAVVAIADGLTVGTDELEAILAAANKTPENLARDVGTRRYRNQQRQRKVEMAQLEMRHAELRRQVAEANEALERAVAEHQQACMPLQFELRNIEQERISRMGIDRELISDCGDAELVERRQMIRAEQHKVQQQIFHAEHYMRGPRQQDELARLRTRAAALVGDENAILAAMLAW